jgi:plastocyanin
MTEDGQAVETLTAGTYTLEVDDKSSAHDFHITGSGVDESTTVEEVGSQTFEITLEAGTYKFQCDPHAGSMNGSVEVSG